MKILSIFIDMVRANRLKLFEPSLKKNNALDNFLEDIGGTVFTNHISPGPDTTRGLASYFSGEPPWINGCDTRIKIASAFLDSKLKTNIDIFEDYNYKQFFFCFPGEVEYIFPKNFYQHEYNKEYNLYKFLNDISLTDNSHLFLALPDFHDCIDDYGANLFGEKIGYSKLVNSLSIVFRKFNPDTFDYIILFADHGFKFSKEYKEQKKKRKLLLFNEDRIRPMLFVREKKQKKLTYDDRLISLADIQKIYINILQKKVSQPLNLPEREFVCFEDHMDFTYSEFMNTEVFGLVNKKHFYIRHFNDCLLLNRHGEVISSEINKRYDSILLNETSFGKKYEYLKKIPNRLTFIAPDCHSDGSKRFKILRQFKNKIRKISKSL